MSLPQFPIHPSNLTREEAINQIISSIAMQELGLSHILNAEGEKIQYTLGTLEGVAPPELPTIDQVLEVNKSVEQLLNAVTKQEMSLQKKLSAALSAATMQGPTGPAGPASTLEGLQMQLASPGAIFAQDETVLFNQVITDASLAIAYNLETGEFQITRPGNYVVNWWIAIDGYDLSSNTAEVSVVVNGNVHSSSSTPAITSQFSGQSFLIVDTVPSIVKIVNTSLGRIQLPGKSFVQGGVVIHGIVII